MNHFAFWLHFPSTSKQALIHSASIKKNPLKKHLFGSREVLSGREDGTEQLVVEQCDDGACL